MLTRLLSVSIKVNVSLSAATRRMIRECKMSFWDWLYGSGSASAGGRG